LILVLIVYFGLSPFSVHIPSAKSTTVLSYPNRWPEAVELISGCQSIRVESFSTGQSALMDRNCSLSRQIVDGLRASSVRKITSKVAVVDGTTQTAIAAYGHNLLLFFELGNGSSVKLDLVGNTVWYEDDFNIYEVDFDPTIFDLVQQFLLSQSSLPFASEHFLQGMKLYVTLNSLSIRAGEKLTVNVTVQNVNNTGVVIFKTLKDYMSVKVWKSTSLVYHADMYVHGQDDVLEIGEKKSCVLRWDTSENMLNGDAPPSPGKYVLQVSASVTDAVSGSRMVLETGLIEVTVTGE